MSEPNANAIKNPSRPATNVRTITSLAMLAAIAYVVMLLSKMLPQVSGFLQMDLKDTVICIGAFLFGPLSAAVISIVVAVVEMFTVSDTGPIGCIMNVLATCAFCCTAAFVYKKFHTRKGAVIGLALGTVCLTVVMLLWNYLITPIYMGMDREEIADPGVPALQPGEGRPEHGADPAALQAGGHRPAEGPAGTGVPCACRGQGQAERRVPPVLPGPAGDLCGAGLGADGDSVNLNTTGAGADTVPAPFTAAHIRPSASPRRYVKTFPSLLPFQERTDVL